MIVHFLATCLTILSLMISAALAESVKVVVAADESTPGSAIPADFLGFSYEKNVLALDHFKPSNAAMINLMRHLGKGVLRFGANYVETTQWQPGKTKSYSNKSAVIGPRELEEMYAFARASGWTVIHGLNLAANDPAMAAAEAAEALRIGGRTLVAFEIGNEPEHYAKVWRPENHDYQDFSREVSSYLDAMRVKMPCIPLAEYSHTGDKRYLDAIAKIYADYPKYNAGKKFSLIHHQGRQLANLEVMLEAHRLGGPDSLRTDALTVLAAQNPEIQQRLAWHEQSIGRGKVDEHFNSVPYGHAVTVNESMQIPAIGYLYSDDKSWLRFSEAGFEDFEKNEMMPYGLTSAHEHVGGGPDYQPKHFPLCCTGNLSRLIPDYVMHLWMRSADGGLSATLHGPSRVKTLVRGVSVELDTATDYPFRDTVAIRIQAEKPVEFPLHYRVPAWCASPTLSINGKDTAPVVHDDFGAIQREWVSGDVIRIAFTNKPRVITGKCADGAPFASVCHGPLLFALPIPADGGNLNQPQLDVNWQFALAPDLDATVKQQPMPDPWTWASAPVQLTVSAIPTKFRSDYMLPKEPIAATGIPQWEITLQPFGTTAFRVSIFGVGK